MIDKREGEFPGMLKERKFRIVRITKNTSQLAENKPIIVDYTGRRVILKF